jgi:hypothetical protein
LSITQAQPGTVEYSFGGGGQADTAILTFMVTLPPGLDLRSGSQLNFDISYVCTGNGQLDSVTTPAILPAAVTIRLNVLSALQASYAGPALDFGEIGEVDTSLADRQRTSGNIRVASSGAYSIAWSSANNFRLVASGAEPGQSGSSIAYSATLAGQTRTANSGSSATIYCQSSGLTGELVPLALKLVEGGRNKNPSNSYRDYIQVTVTPLVDLAGSSPASCGQR